MLRNFSFAEYQTTLVLDLGRSKSSLDVYPFVLNYIRMLSLRSPPPQISNYVAMPSKNRTTFPGFQDNSASNCSSSPTQGNRNELDKNEQDNVHLPNISKDTSNNSKSERKPNRFFKFSAEKQSFTENLLSLFTGNREKGVERSHTFTKDSRVNGPSKDSSTTQHGPDARRRVPNKGEKPMRSNSNPTNSTRPPMQRTDKTRITATTKNDSFRVANNNAIRNAKGIQVDAESDVGGYENMYKMKQPINKFNVPRKRSLEITEYIRRENYKYNERTAKQFLFQKWLKSTEFELPEEYPIQPSELKESQ